VQGGGRRAESGQAQRERASWTGHRLRSTAYKQARRFVRRIDAQFRFAKFAGIARVRLDERRLVRDAQEMNAETRNAQLAVSRFPIPQRRIRSGRARAPSRAATEAGRRNQRTRRWLRTCRIVPVALRKPEAGSRVKTVATAAARAWRVARAVIDARLRSVEAVGYRYTGEASCGTPRRGRKQIRA